ncbi:phosphotransferase family protein [Fimbriimonas ginsengisoli]|uniref:Aminoglycoside phosphotransferase n=1 Tax=Fimbriimonas ginsengisoli Gsoil 348 TaxID=661478 RepID=A0A068NXA7_FIMGI|nr:phosphotransferase [Fimbriimonas ginsengisoli]AIE87982.1 aminoglycoside phosphotransferase [Fimbriimonas ginsengisoli Gsoil 348]
MESTWGRGMDFVRLSLAEINDLLSPSEMVAADADLLPEGHANTNYRLDLADGSHAVLRLYQRDPGAARLEWAIADRLGGEVPVPRVLYFDNGRQFAVIEWKLGETMERLLASGLEAEVSDAATDIGRTLAVISKVRFDQAGFLDADLEVSGPWPSVADGLFGHLDFLLDQPLVQARAGGNLCRRIRPVSAAARKKLNDIDEPPCLVHGDYKATNLLIHEGRLSAVLDWEFAHSGTWLMSVGQIFRHAVPRGFEERFEAGFREGGGKLPPGWRQLAREIDLLSMVDFLSRESADEARIAGSIAIIERTLSIAG